MTTWYKKEDSWAMLIALLLLLLATLLFTGGASGGLRLLGAHFATWSSWATLTATLAATLPALAVLYLLLLALVGLGARGLGYDGKRFLLGFSLLYGLGVLVALLSSNSLLKSWQLESPLLALAVGLIWANGARLPHWLESALRTEFYVKTGIVLMGATLPFSLILTAGPAAIGQALIVSVVTFVSIFLIATRGLGLDKRFAACLSAGASICGVSGAIAIGGACRARKEQVSVAISLVIVWAVVMIFVLPLLCRALGLDSGVAGAWIGTSEFADAAGFAAAAAIGDEAAKSAFTLMKVVGRDMFVGVWAFIVALLSVSVWERQSLAHSERIGAGEIWQRFPKFILGFFLASLLTTLVIGALGAGGTAYQKEALGALKNLRGWFFTLTFLSIGLTTRFRELTAVGFRPLLAFSLGVAINLPLGYWLSNHVFADFWRSLPKGIIG